MKNLKHIFVAVLLAASPAAFAYDSMSFEYGQSNSSHVDVDLYRVGVQWDWGKRWFDTGNWSLGGFWDVSLGYWDNKSVRATTNSMGDISLTPVFRWQQDHPQNFSPYAELGVGAHFLSTTSINEHRRMSTSYQFGDHVGAGVRLGDRGQYDIEYRYQHLSNAGIKEPNQGINFNQVRFQYHF